MTEKKRTVSLIIHIILIAGSLIMLIPFAWDDTDRIKNKK